MNEGGLLTWKLKTRQPRAEGMGVERCRRWQEEIKRGCSALWAQPCQLPSRFLPRAEDPTAPATAAGAGPGPGDKPKPSSSHPASSPCTVQHSAEKGRRSQRGLAPRALQPLVRACDQGDGGWSPARWTPDPGVATASSFKLAVVGISFPAEPRHPLPSPHL